MRIIKIFFIILCSRTVHSTELPTYIETFTLNGTNLRDTYSRLRDLAEYVIQESHMTMIMQEDVANERDEVDALQRQLIGVQDRDKDTPIPTNCDDAIILGNGRSGVYTIKLTNSSLGPFEVYCQLDKRGGTAWTIFQRRKDGSVDFYRNWMYYKYGFGNLDGEHFLGLERLYVMTNALPHEMWVEVEDWENRNAYALYRNFSIGNECSGYPITALNYSGTAGNSLQYHLYNKFTTVDVHNDENKKNCAARYSGAWWYRKCHDSNLNGKYFLKGNLTKEDTGKGVIWYGFAGNQYSLKYAHMALRPVYNAN